MVNVDVREAIRELRRGLPRDMVNVATMRAINHTLGKARTAISKEVRERYKLKAKDVRERLILSRTDKVALRGSVTGKSSSLSLYYFGARQTKRGVTVNVTGQRKLVGSAWIRNGVVYARGEYKAGKFKFRDKRINKRGSDLPINKLTSITVPQAMAQINVVNNVNNFTKDAFRTRLAHELSRMR